MSQEPVRPAPASRQALDAPPRHTGTVQRRDPRRKTPTPSPRTSWLFGVIGLVIGAFVISGIVVGGSSAPVSTPGSTTTPSGLLAALATASAAAGSAAAMTIAPTLAFEPIATQEPSASPTLVPTVPATPRPTPTPDPTLEPTLEPQLGLTFDFPYDGDVLSDADINVIGRAPPGSTITRDVPMWFDDHTLTRDDGIWMMPIHLDDGQNLLRFRIGDDRSTEQLITVTYRR